jgi:hypothetical protein
MRSRLSLSLTISLGVLVAAVVVAPAHAKSDKFILVSTIAFASLRDGDLEIFLMNPDGSDQRQLTDRR